MSETGPNLLALFLDVRKVHVEVARLLGTVEERLRDRGWKSAATDSLAIGYLAFGLDYPRWWMPAEAFRFFRAPDPTHRVLAFVSVIFMPHDDERGDFELTEPLVTAGWFDYEMDLPAINAAMQWHARFHCYSSKRPTSDGRIEERRTAEYTQAERDKYKYGFRRVRTFGRPLVEMTAPEALETLVITPLLEDILTEAKATGATGP